MLVRYPKGHAVIEVNKSTKTQRCQCRVLFPLYTPGGVTVIQCPAATEPAYSEDDEAMAAARAEGFAEAKIAAVQALAHMPCLEEDYGDAVVQLSEAMRIVADLKDGD